MEFAEVVRRRRMVRRFLSDPVEGAALDRVLDAGLRAPSAGHAQCVELVVLRAGAVERYWAVAAGGRTSAWLEGLRTAPVLITVWTSERAYRDRYAEADKQGAELVAPWWWVDAGMSVEAMLLAAVDVGLGACFFGLPPGGEADVRAFVGQPAHLQAVGVVALGHPHPDDRPGRSAARPRRADRVRLFDDSQQNFG